MAVGENIVEIQKSIPSYVQLIAVSKTRSIEEMKEAYNTGLRDFGENKVQELVEKYDRFGSDVRWHLIGHLQRNKVKYIAGKVFLIHSLDSIRLLEEIDRQYCKVGLIADTLIEINIGREDSKTGILPEELDNLLEEVGRSSNVRVKGIMVIIPKADEESARGYFKAAREIYEKLKNCRLENVSMEYLSMGMTGDYRIAVEEGSNMIRIGEGIFGRRIYDNK